MVSSRVTEGGGHVRGDLGLRQVITELRDNWERRCQVEGEDVAARVVRQSSRADNTDRR
jgi:hypothetical protein